MYALFCKCFSAPRPGCCENGASRIRSRSRICRKPNATAPGSSRDLLGQHCFKLAVPMVFGILSMVAYNLADTFFVGRLGRDQLAALSFTFPVVLTIGSLAQGIGMGTSAVVSRAVGAADYPRGAGA